MYGLTKKCDIRKICGMRRRCGVRKRWCKIGDLRKMWRGEMFQVIIYIYIYGGRGVSHERGRGVVY